MNKSNSQESGIHYVEQTLGVTRGELVDIVGCSYSSLQRLATGSRTARIVGKEPEIIAMLERIARAVVGLYQGDTAMVKHWMRMSPPNEATPISKMGSLENVVCIMCELESRLERLKEVGHV